MLTLILLIGIGSVFAYLAQNNMVLVTVHVGTHLFSGIPLFYVIMGSLLTGLGVAYLISLVNSLFTSFSLHRKDNEIKQGNSDIVDLTKRIHQLELENERLKHTTTVAEPVDKNAL